MPPDIQSLISKIYGQIYVRSNGCLAYDRFWVIHVITFKDLALCHQRVPERRNHQAVHFVLASMNQEPVPIDHCLSGVSILAWLIAVV